MRHYLSANYTHVARDTLARGVNVIAHLVAQRSVNGELQVSFGSNPDVTVDLLPHIEASRAEGRDIVMVGQTHAQMPFMTGQALIDPGRFDFLVDDPRYDYDLFCPPNPPLGTVDHAIGMYASALVRDGGTLQIDRKSTRSELQSQSNLVCRLLLEKKKPISSLRIHC